MTTLNQTLIQDFTRNYQNSAGTIHGLVDPLSDEQIWTRPYHYGNSIGNLILHLTGNLNNYFGAEMGGTGYVRNRPLEFAETSRIPKDELLKRFDEAIAVAKRIGEVDPDDVLAHTSLSILYQKKGMIAEAEEESNRARILGWKQQLKQGKQ